MHFEKLIDLIGHSVFHPDVKAVLKDLNYEGPSIAETGTHGFLNIPNAYKKEIGVELEFTTRIACGEDLKSSFTKEKYELVVKSIQFWKLFKSEPYPFQLSPDDDEKAVINKLNTKPYTKRKGSSGGIVCWYYKDNFEIVAQFNNEKRLGSCLIMLQNEFAKKSAKLKAAAKEQKNNITTEHLDDLRSLAAKLPTEDWLQHMEEEKEDGETPFTIENIKAAEEVLKVFIAELELAVQKNKVSQIDAAVKKAVKKLDKLNLKYDSFIETMEREDLVNFMTKAVRLTGYKIEEGADITASYRKDW